jgi:hypothetical protein
MAETNALRSVFLSLLSVTFLTTSWANNPESDKDHEVITPEQADEQISYRKTTFEIGGFAKTDLIFSHFKAGELSSDSLGRDLYVPATVPVGNAGNRYSDLHAKETRINFSATHFLDSGARVKAFLEVDLLRPDQDTSRPRLRHAFINAGNWTLGKTWTTLFNISALPENLDFIGPAESTIFRRQAMIRYTHGPWQFALENPRTTITPFGGGSRIAKDDIHTPDAIMRYNHEGTRSTFTAAGIVRQLGYENSMTDSKNTSTGFGISLSGKINVGEADDFRWMASSGKGLGHYLGLNTANGAVLDASDQLETIASNGLFGSYRHVWNDHWRSNLTLGHLAVDNELALTGQEVTKSASSMHINLIFSPRTWLDFGVEFMLARRELENGVDGNLQRLQISTKFSY